jgi:pyridoxamine 5'-phosphate oxidase
MSIESHRKSYEKHALEMTDCLDSPDSMLGLWLSEVNELPDYNSMVIGTVDAHLQPHSRVVLLRGLDEQGLRFYTNYDSNKGVEIAENNKVSVNFFWPTVERQVRVEGSIVPLSSSESDAYFHSRPRESQIGAWVSPQSQVIANRDVLSNRFEEISKQFEGKEIPRPTNWGGYLIRPNMFEFWQGRPNRLHDRIRYVKHAEGWSLMRVAP